MVLNIILQFLITKKVNLADFGIGQETYTLFNGCREFKSHRIK